MSPTPHDPSAVDASLHLLVDSIIDGLVDGHLEPCLFHLIPDAEGVNLGVLPLDGAHPTDLLLGFVAPPEWYALGIATGGKVYDIADRATGAPALHRVAIVTVLSRSGEVANRTHVPGEIELSHQLSDSGDELDGLQMDLLRLALGQPTAPPPCGSVVYWTIEWLSGLLGRPAPHTWDDVMRRHPAMQLPRTRAAVRSEHDFVDAAGAFVRVCSWPRLRSLVVDGVAMVPELASDDARWLDDGAFARFVLSRCPPLRQLRDDALEMLPPHLGEQLCTTLEQLGVPEVAWPDNWVEDRAA